MGGSFSTNLKTSKRECITSYKLGLILRYETVLGSESLTCHKSASGRRCGRLWWTMMGAACEAPRVLPACFDLYTDIMQMCFIVISLIRGTKQPDRKQAASGALRGVSLWSRHLCSGSPFANGSDLILALKEALKSKNQHVTSSFEVSNTILKVLIVILKPKC